MLPFIVTTGLPALLLRSDDFAALTCVRLPSFLGLFCLGEYLYLNLCDLKISAPNPYMLSWQAGC